jgi:hypothetical protein
MILSDYLTTDTLVLILLGLVVLVAVALVRLEIKLRRLCRGQKGADLEATINGLGASVDALKKFEGESKGYFKNIERRIRRSTQSVDTVRFNAFRGDGLGGNQSFATAFVNEEGDGAVMSSIYTRERVSVFSKPLSKFTSVIELSEEESQAVTRARAKLSGK